MHGGAHLLDALHLVAPLGAGPRQVDRHALLEGVGAHGRRRHLERGGNGREREVRGVRGRSSRGAAPPGDLKGGEATGSKKDGCPRPPGTWSVEQGQRRWGAAACTVPRRGSGATLRGPSGLRGLLWSPVGRRAQAGERIGRRSSCAKRRPPPLPRPPPPPSPTAAPRLPERVGPSSQQSRQLAWH